MEVLSFIQKRGLLLLYFIFVFYLSGCFLCAGTAYADTVFSEDFASGYDGWTWKAHNNRDCRFSIVSGTLQEKSNSANGELICPYTSDSTNYTISCDMRSIGSSNSGVGIAFGYEDGYNYWLFRWMDPETDTLRELVQYIDGTEYVRASSNGSTWSRNAWYTLSVVVSGGTVTCKVGTSTVASYSATVPLNYSGIYGADNDGGVQSDNYTIAETGSSGEGPRGTPQGNYYTAEEFSYSTFSGYSTKVSLQFTPAAASEHWVVVTTWRTIFEAPESNQYHVRWCRILLNGSVRTGTDEIGYKQSGSNWKSFQNFFMITGTTAQQTVELQADSYGMDCARIVAFRIPNPESADIHYFEDLTEHINISPDGVTPFDYNLTFSPTSAGDYIVMANAYCHEGPSGANHPGVYFVDDTGTELSHSSENWLGGNDQFVPFFYVGKHTVTTGSKTFKVRHKAFDQSVGNTIRGVTILAFRADAFDKVQSATSTTTESTTSTAWQTKLSLTTDISDEPCDRVFLASFENRETELKHCYGRIRLAGRSFMEKTVCIDRGNTHHQVGMGWADTTKGGEKIELEYCAESGGTTTAINSNIVVLWYPPMPQFKHDEYWLNGEPVFRLDR